MGIVRAPMDETPAPAPAPAPALPLPPLVGLGAAGDRVRAPPPPSVVGPTTKIVKVKQPWAQALVLGEKDVENRTWPLTPDCGPDRPVWMLVASSKAAPSRALMDDYERRLRLQWPERPPLPRDAAQGYAYGKILGLVRLRGCYPSWPSVWYNPPDLAWVVDDAWPFATPVDLDPSDGMQTQGSLGDGRRAAYAYVERVRAEVAKLGPARSDA